MNDPAHKRIVILGILENVSAGDHILKLEAWMKQHFPDVRSRDILNKHQGSFKDRTKALSSTALVGFSSSDIRNLVAEKLSANKGAFKINRSDVTIKKAAFEDALKRNGTLKDALKVLQGDSRCDGRDVKIVWDGERGVTVDKAYAFEQPRENLGTSLGLSKI